MKSITKAELRQFNYNSFDSIFWLNSPWLNSTGYILKLQANVNNAIVKIVFVNVSSIVRDGDLETSFAVQNENQFHSFKTKLQTNTFVFSSSLVEGGVYYHDTVVEGLSLFSSSFASKSTLFLPLSCYCFFSLVLKSRKQMFVVFFLQFVKSFVHTLALRQFNLHFICIKVNTTSAIILLLFFSLVLISKKKMFVVFSCILLRVL